MTRTRSLIAALALLSIAVPISGCGSGTPAGTAGAQSTTTTASEAVRFSECMRGHGVGRFPDPGPSGKLTIDEIANGSSLDTSSPTFTRALSACHKLEPGGFTGRRRSAAQTRAALRFAACIRAHGVTDFPDPINGQPLIDTNRIPSTATPTGMSILNAAMQRCSAYSSAAGVTR